MASVTLEEAQANFGGLVHQLAPGDELLDSHTVIWSMDNPAKLNRLAVEVIDRWWLRPRRTA